MSAQLEYTESLVEPEIALGWIEADEDQSPSRDSYDAEGSTPAPLGIRNAVRSLSCFNSSSNPCAAFKTSLQEPDFGPMD